MKDGKLPLSRKVEYIDPSEAFGGMELDIPKELKEYFEKNELAYKWLAIKTIKEKGGRHPRGWDLFVVPKELKDHMPINKFNQVGTNYVESGDLILGTKPKYGPGRSQENHRKVLRNKVIAKTMEAQGVDANGDPLIKVER